MNTDIDRLHEVADAVRLGKFLPSGAGETTYNIHCVCGYVLLGHDVIIIVPSSTYSLWLPDMIKDVAYEYEMSLSIQGRCDFSMAGQHIRIIVADRNLNDKLRGLSGVIVNEY